MPLEIGAVAPSAPVTMAQFIVHRSYHNERACSNSYHMCCVGKAMARKLVCCICDNAAVVAMVTSGSSKNVLVMQLMWCLFFQAVLNLSIHAVYLAGKRNVAAGSLSKDKSSLFCQKVPTASPQPTRLLEEFLKAIIHHCPDWTLKTWKIWFNSIILKV